MIHHSTNKLVDGVNKRIPKHIFAGFIFSQLQGRKEGRKKKATTQFYLENQLSAIITIPIIVQMSLCFYTLELAQLNAHGTPVSSHVNRSV